MTLGADLSSYLNTIISRPSLTTDQVRQYLKLSAVGLRNRLLVIVLEGKE